MPRKVREIEADLKRAGFVPVGGKGSHRKYIHPSGVKCQISGQAGADAKHYQEEQAAAAIRRARG